MRALCARSALVVGLLTVIVGASCTSAPTGDPNAEFCNRIRSATGALGAETTFDAGDPARLEQTIEELREIAALAPDDVDDTTARMVEIFELVRQTPRDEVRDVLGDAEGELAQLSTQLTSFTLDNCGVILQRAAPTPTPVPVAVDITE